jgi:hypothetical protein
MLYVKKLLKNLWQQALTRVVIQFSTFGFDHCFCVDAAKINAVLCLQNRQV